MGNVNMKIKLVKAANSFVIWTYDAIEKPKFIIEKATLYLRKVRPNPQIANHVYENISKGAVVYYPINRTELTMLSISAGTLDFCKDQLFYGKMPKLLVMSMVDNVALNGVYGKNPFNFKHFGIKSIDLRVNGVSKPILPLTRL